MRGDHGAVRRFVEFDAQIVEPLNGFRCIADELGEQFAFGRKMTAAEGIQEVDRRRVVRLVGSLNAAFCHHGVGVADAELRHDHGFCARVVGFNRRRSACAAAADDQHIDVIADVFEVDVFRGDAAVRLKHIAQFMRDIFALVRADFQR